MAALGKRMDKAMADDGDRQAASCPRWTALLIVLAVAVFGVAQWRLSALTGPTADEWGYVEAAYVLGEGVTDLPALAIKQGPLPLHLQRLLLPPEPIEDGHLTAARRGMILFALLTAVVLARMAWLAFGSAAALLATLLYVSDSTVLGHGHLTTADTAMAALSTLTLFCLWRWLQSPCLWRLLFLGLSLGAAMATKYVNTLLVPVIVCALLWATVTGFRPRLLWSRAEKRGAVRAWLDLPLVLLLLGLTSLLALHASYLGWTATYNPAVTAPQSTAIAALMDTPGLGSLLRLLPDPMLRGLDFDLAVMVNQPLGTRFMGRIFRHGSAAYFVVALGLKLSLVTLALLLVTALSGLRRWPKRLAPVVLLGAGVPLCTLSFLSRTQIGVRYVLPVFPLLFLAAAGALTLLSRRPRRTHALVALAALTLVFDTAGAWPYYIGHFNPLVGRYPHVWFADSSFGWCVSPGLQRRRAEIFSRHPGAEEVLASSGPRFGTIIAQGNLLWSTDPEDPTRVHHWLRRFPVIDRECCLLVFDCSPEAFSALVAPDGEAPDPRGLVDLAVATLGDDRPEDARRLVRQAREADSHDPRLAALDELLLAARGELPPTPAVLARWIDIGRPDLALAHAELPPALRAEAHIVAGQFEQARGVLSTLAEDRPLSFQQTLQWAYACFRLGDVHAAVEVLGSADVPADSPQARRRDELLAAWSRFTEEDSRMAERGGLRGAGGGSRQQR